MNHWFEEGKMAGGITGFDGKTAVVTGGASGIGEALARRFGREGMNIVLADVDQEELALAEKRLAEVEGVGEVLAVPTDVRHLDQVESLHQAAHQRFGNIHLVCNNAGVFVGGKNAWEHTADDWSWCIEVNLMGVIHGVRTFVPHMIDHGEGAHVLNTASIAGHLASPSLGPYNVTKYAVVALSETMHAELAMTDANVGVSVLCPAFVKTRIIDPERLRPEDRPDSAMSAEETDQREMMGRAVIESATAPSEIADLAFEAVAERRLWILPHSYLHHIVEDRWESIRSALGPLGEMPPIGG